ncbi:hypothetical protein NPIL_75721 [Nephila pilipes]|uniref:Uncharacterized protein n=1 Tax=Nephila pilipes TaxID=299642 RepID=A0A8X6PPF8_NEPPI|nr:hypothetical protein NPIL_75721 [Nephila pilipes]
MFYTWNFRQIIRVCWSIGLEEVLRLVSSFGVVFGTILMLYGIWGITENAFTLGFFSLPYFCILAVGILIQFISLIQIYSTFETEARNQTTAYCGMIYSVMCSISALCMCARLHYSDVGKLYPLLFICLSLFCCYPFYSFFGMVNSEAPVIYTTGDISVNIEII